MYGICIQGQKHALRESACEDWIYVISETEDSFVGVLCDGMGSYKMSGLYAKELAKEAATFLYKNYDTAFTMTNDSFKDIFFDFEKTFSQEFIKRHPNTQFGCTLLAVIVPAKHKDFAILHVGDGAALGIPNCDSEFAMEFSNAENYGSQNATISISNREAKKLMRFTRQRKEDFISVLIGSDGGIAPYANNMNFASGHTYDIIKDILTGNRSLADVVLEDHLGVCNVTDDISLLLLKLSDIPGEKSFHGYIPHSTILDLEEKAIFDEKNKGSAPTAQQNLFRSEKHSFVGNHKDKSHHFREKGNIIIKQKKGAKALIIAICAAILLTTNIYTYSVAFEAKKKVEVQNEIILDLSADLNDIETMVKALEQSNNNGEDKTSTSFFTEKNTTDTLPAGNNKNETNSKPNNSESEQTPDH